MGCRGVSDALHPVRLPSICRSSSQLQSCKLRRQMAGLEEGVDEMGVGMIAMKGLIARRSGRSFCAGLEGVS
jgi:hypothetical protein